MKIFGINLRRETAIPLLALVFATGVSVALIVARIAWTQNIRYALLLWNLFLAWLPLLFALRACDRYRNGAGRDWRFAALAGAWLLFFPNAPYIFTDLIHLTGWFQRHFWVDMVLILLCALTGLVLGFVSLYLMQSLVTRRLGRAASWIFVLVVAGLSGFGIYLGRFLRFNSWDILVKPVKLYHDIGKLTTEPLSHPAAVGMSALFATFLFVAYLLLYALTHLPQADQLSLAPAAEPSGRT